MVEKAKKHKKGTISEGDVSTLLQRYSATTVLSLLQEVAQVPEVKIDWNALVKKTATGISNAREYQMLWRHLAYRDSMVDRLDDESEPLDDDSDLDYELEAIPPVSSEASTEATACAKVLISSGSQSDTSLPNGLTVEAPLTINIPNGEPFRAPSENSQLQGTNITIPVTVQKQPLPTVTSSEGLDANGLASGNLPPRRKRKPWSAAEDLELIAAVKKCGEGNWANILKGDFKGDRTASQLSQRWAIIRKRQGNSNISSGSQLSEAQLAARRAVSMALNMPMVDNLTAACSNAGTNPNTMPGNTASPAATEASVGVQSQQQSRQDCAPLSKPRVPAKKPSIIKPVLSPDAMVKAAAVAAGARIATPSDAASLLKAAQSKNAVHIMPGGSSLVKSSVGGNASALPPNVHFIRTGLAPVQHSAYPAAATNASRSGGTLQAQNNSPKPGAPAAQLHSTRTAAESNPSAVATNVIASSPASDLKADDIINSVPSNPPKEQIQENQVTIPGREQVQETGAAALGNALEEKVQNDQVSVSSSPPKEQSQDQASALSNAPNEQVQEDQTALPSSDGQNDFVENLKCSSSPDNPADCQTVTTSTKAVTGSGSGSEKGDDEMLICTALEQGSENQSMVEVVPESQILDVKQTDLAGTGRDGSDENMEVAD
ncbi:uncharacterized protein LOC127799176 isoform X4 [Diospyros lotus]|uniref:uncharacterized protein LOC127799176 isoform X1 n=1 Tax=Diospyros lotus TaxID=55363 RepID=UPI00224F4364|nr:uncharacterized protein LOC127799176 isoform X1 [Diospyros lotus]XP_052188901.1 uncharacterized protein LOC127799176 isoform X4 [Diospyros lotus]